MRYFAELSYNGKHYHGWQSQPNAKTVQETLENAFSTLLRSDTALTGCGRTDTGVHASQFYAHFDAVRALNPDVFTNRLNAFLPEDIVIKRIIPLHEDAHARFDAVERTYEYRIFLGRDPFLTDFTWQLHHEKLNVSLMNEAASVLFDYTDFKSFSRSKTDVKTFNCVIKKAKWTQKGRHLVFEIAADRFLRNMVRAIVGTLLEVGREKLTIDGFKKIIESKDRTKAGVSVKAKGLFLTAVKYPYAL